MSNGTRPPPMPVAWNDFYKTNGTKSEMITVGASMTRQEFAEECDINFLMRRFETTGFLPPMPDAGVPVYVDFTAVPSDLMASMAVMHEAEAAFMQLPARVRKEFDNNAYEFVAFATDPANLGQMQEWGLAPKPEPAPVVAPGGPPPGAPPAGGPQVPPPVLPPQEPPKSS